MAKEMTVRELAELGGKARWKAVPKAERSARMRRLVLRRWKKARQAAPP